MRIQAALIFLMASTAFAADAKWTPEQAKLDLDKNGTLSRDEVSANSEMTAAFAISDKDRNGQLTAEEWINRPSAAKGSAPAPK